MKDYLISFFAVLIAGTVGMIGGDRGRKRVIQNEAVQVGVARWTANPKTGAREFKWITNEKEQGK